jgi:alpha-L-rhamnosidase
MTPPAQAGVVDLRCDGRREPLAVAGRPRLSWRLEGEALRAVEVTVSGGGTDWTAAVDDARSIDVPLDLPPGEELVWEVAATRPDGQPVTASSRFRTAPDADIWSGAEWIGLRRPEQQDDQHRPCPELTGRLELPAPVTTGVLHLTAGGVYRAWLNGELLPGELLPGFTDYRLRIPYETYDVSTLLRAGENVLTAEVADGWWSGYLGFTGTRGQFGELPVLRGVLTAECEDGSRHVLRTGRDWRGRFGRVVAADLQRGQVLDLRRPAPGDTVPDGQWQQVDVLPGPGGRLVPRACDPVQVARLQPAVSRSEPEPGVFVYDLGANVVGRVRARLSGPAGSTVVLRHAEALDADGRLYTTSLRAATSVDTVVLAGDEQVVEPVHTSHGFRYVEIRGCDAPDAADVAGVVLTSVPELTGSFRCSSELVNRLVDNVGRSLQGNFVDIPTDCPQRDERLGWTGDAQVFAPTACLLADVQAFFAKWLDDLYDAQSAEGAFPDVAPRVAMPTDGAPGWGDAGAIVPWVLWEHYGDRRVLERAHEPMRAWVRYVQGRDPGLLWRGDRNNDYGDWLAPLPPGDPGLTDKDLLAAVFAARSARLLARTSAALSDPRAADDAAHADAVAAAFRAAHLPSLETWTQTACALALRFDVLLPEQVPQVSARLVEDVEQRGHLTTGFLGVAHLLPALVQAGRPHLAYGLLLREELPSWLYPVRMGATSVWERWDGWTEEHGFADPEMNSFNHYSLGSVVEWLLTAVAGLSPAVPGWSVARVAPVVGPGLDWARGEVPTPYGPLSCGWRRDGSGVALELHVPTGMRAVVELPVGPGQQTELDGAPCERVLELGHGSWTLAVR